MEPVAIAGALLSAVLHASWNAMIRASPNPPAAMAAQMWWSALIVAPGLLATGLPALLSWPWIAASTLANLLTVNALLKAYEHGGFGTIYPIQRAISVLCVVPLAALLVGELPGPYALGGIVLIAAALMLIGISVRRDAAFPLPALLWTMAAGATTALYVLSDAKGVRLSGSPWAYGFAVSITNAVAMSLWQRTLGSPVSLIVRHWRRALPAGFAAVISYQLILLVFTLAPIAPAAALRDTSALFAILIAVLVMKEPFGRLRFAAVLLAALAVPLLRLG